MNLEDMIIDKTIYKRFGNLHPITAAEHGGTPFELTSDVVSFSRHGFFEDKTKVYEFMPKIKGVLSIQCFFAYGGIYDATGVFYIYVDDILQKKLNIISFEGVFRTDSAVITFAPFSKIKILAEVREHPQNEGLNISKEAYVKVNGSIVDDVNQYIIEVNE